MNEDQAPEPVNDEPMPEEEGDDGPGPNLGPIVDELEEQGKAIQFLDSENSRAKRDIEEINQKLNEGWPFQQGGDDAASTNLVAWWVIKDGGTAGDEATQCSHTYTIQKPLPGDAGGDGTNIATGVLMSGNGLRGSVGAMNPGNRGIGYIGSDGKPVLRFVDETPAPTLAPIKTLSPGSGLTPASDSYTRDVDNMAVTETYATRSFWDISGDVLYYFTRQRIFDSAGRLYHISEESINTVDDAEPCS